MKGFKKKLKKTLALLLSLALCLGLMPATVYAAEVIDVRGSGYRQFVEVIPNYDWPLLYTGEEQDLLDVTVKVNGVTLTEGTDYEVSYDRSYWRDDAKAAVGSNENPVGSADATLEYPIRVDFKGNYSGYWIPSNDGSGTIDSYGAAVQYRIMPRLTETVSGGYTVNQGTENEIQWSWTLDTDGLLTMSGEGEMPYAMQTSSNANWHYDYQKYVKKLVVTGNVTSICDSAFSTNSNLVDATLPDTVQVLENSAFGSIKTLRSVHTPGTDRLPSALTTLGTGVFGGNTYNLEVHLPDNVTSIGQNNAYSSNKVYCKHGTATEASMKQNYNTYMVEGAEGFYFYGGSQGGGEEDYKLYRYNGPGGEVTLPFFATEIPESNLFNSTKATITKVTIPASIKSFDVSAFEGLTKLREIEIEPGELTTLPSGFPGDSDNYTITIPDTVMTVDGFSGNNHLLIVGAGSAAYQWAVDNEYTEYTGGEIDGKYYQLRDVTQPYIAPANVETDTDSLTDLTITKNDGSFIGGEGHFTFDSVKNESTALTPGTDYAVSGDTVTIKASYLESLGAGNHTLTFHYTGTAESGAVSPTDPTLTITIAQMASPALVVKGNGDTDVTGGCTVVWKKGENVVTTPISELAGTILTYTITPGDTLKVDGVQYYKETTGSVTLNTKDQPVTVALKQQGTITVTPTANGTSLPEGYTVKWYTKNGTDYSQKGTGVTSPMADAGTKLYYDIIMTGENAVDYKNVEKASVDVSYGNTGKNHDVTGRNNIVLNISGTKAGGDGITDTDYTVTWYVKNNEGGFEKAGLSGKKLTNLAGRIGTDYYYEIAPKDSGSVKNWVLFHGVPASEDTRITVMDEPQSVDVELAAVTMKTISGTVTNASTIGAGNLGFSVTQEPWKGYQCGPAYNSYADKWSAILFTNNGGYFSAEVYDFDTVVRTEDKLGNFQTAFKAVRKEDLETPVSLTLSAEALPETLGLTIRRTYPANNTQGYDSADLSFGYGSEGCFAELSFALHNDTTGANITPDLYTVTPTEVRFTDSTALADVVSMGDKLTLTATLADGTGAVLTAASDDLTVSLKYADADSEFSLAYQEYGRVWIDADSGSRVYQTYALYDSNGDLADSGRFYRSGFGRQIPAGVYTVCVWREQSWLNAPATLTELKNILKSDEYQTTSVTIKNGEQTGVTLGASPNITERALFTDVTGFTDMTVKASIGEWALVSLAYEVDPVLVDGYSIANYAIDVRTTLDSAHTYDQTVLLRYADGHNYGEAAPDKYISLYSDDKYMSSNVKIGYKDADHLGTVKGFTLYTDQPKGVVYFYVQSNKGGDFSIAAEGTALNAQGNTIRSASLDSMTFTVEAASSALNFTSDYLHAGYNGVWLYTIPGQDVTLFMDGVPIASASSNGAGIASFSFTMGSARIGSADISAFREKNIDWRVMGSHELSAVTTVDGKENRSATAVMEYASFDPAVLTKLEVTSYSDNTDDAFSGKTETLMQYSDSKNVPSLTTYYWSLNDQGTTFSYTFTAAVENADSLDPDYGLRVYATGQDGLVHSAVMKRDEATGKYTAAISGERLLFTNWAVDIHSKKPSATGPVLLAVGDDVDIVALLGADTMVTDLSGNASTIQKEYDRAAAELEQKQSDGTLESERSAYLADYEELLSEYAKMLGVDDFILDGSEESAERMREIFGIRIGVAGDVDYESWGTDYASATLPDGREMRARSDVEKMSDGRWLYTSEAVVLPGSEDDPGYSQIHQIYFSDTETSKPKGISTRGNSLSIMSAPTLKIGDGTTTIPTFKASTTDLVNGLNSRLKAAYQKYSGRSQSERDSMNYAQRMQMLNGGSNGYGQHQKATKANLTIQNRINDLIGLGPQKLGQERYQRLVGIKTQIDNAVNQSQYSDFGHALAAVVDGAEEYSIGGPKKYIKEKIKDYSSKKYQEQYGDEIPTSWLSAGSMLAKYFFSDKMSDADHDIFMAAFELEDLLDEMDVPPAATCGGSARATHDPEGIIYEAVLSNPVEGATATIYVKTENGEVVWEAGDYGQVNPQVTNASGQYQWFVPEAEWQVRVTAPEGSDYADSSSADHPAANLDDGSAKGWLPVMPVQMGIHIPMVSTRSPEVTEVALFEDHADIAFSLYMDISSLTDTVITVRNGSDTIPCTIEFPDQEADPLNEKKVYAKTVVLTPEGGSFDAGKTYVIRVTTGATGYNDKTLEEAYDSENFTVPAKYSNEWVDGKWYNKDGTQTYAGIGKWRKSSKGWWYGDDRSWYAKNQWQKIDGKWYFFDKQGYMEANAYRQGYYFKANGVWDGKAKVAGWKKDSKGWWYSSGGKNYLKNCWEKIDGKWYYFKADGYMAQNEFVSGWWCDKNGVQNDPVKYSWHKTGRGWWYGVNGGWYAKNATYTIDGKSYTFDKIGYQK